jgi:hypothetical protein
MKKVFLLSHLALFLLGTNLFSQVGDRLTSLDPDNVALYAKPLSTFMGSYFNSGAYYSAKVSKIFGFRFTIVGMLVSIPEDQRTFTPLLPDGYDNSEKTATFFGNKGTAYPGPDGFIVFPPGIDQSSFPAGIPQVAFSLVGVEALIRYFPKFKIDDTETKLLGWGLKYNVSQWIPMSPIDIAVQVLFNNIKVDYNPKEDDANQRNFFKVNSKNWAFNAHVSKSFNLFNLYGGLQYEKTSMDLDYNFRLDPDNPDLDQEFAVTIDGDNKVRLTLGAALQLGILVINADYNIASQNLLTAGVSLAF